MISSPCKRCERRNDPKDECLKSCKILHDVQEFHLMTAKNICYSAIDCTEESRYHIKSPSPVAMGSF
ncbi:hypothetical protein DESC_160034 [Desulfosarcina cetonica]|uniref:hypothetical protein n=1 Tax=Desulfosarcina cetonica TaxID=90730 RepID=UPI0006D22E25|nr:hypothetical protein [Desulfosarcina cetonica]VTR64279.1 hypothetical protein DESC_160034 [Desulfosarcina cetonica]